MLQRCQPNQMPRAQDWNELCDIIDALMRSSPSLGSVSAMHGLSFRQKPETWFVAEITDRRLYHVVRSSDSLGTIYISHEGCDSGGSGASGDSGSSGSSGGSGSGSGSGSGHSCYYRYSWRTIWTDGRDGIVDSVPSYGGTYEQNFAVSIVGELEILDRVLMRAGQGPWFEAFSAGMGTSEIELLKSVCIQPSSSGGV